MILSTVHVNIGCDVEVLGHKPSLLILIFNSFGASSWWSSHRNLLCPFAIKPIFLSRRSTKMILRFLRREMWDNVWRDSSQKLRALQNWLLQSGQPVSWILDHHSLNSVVWRINWYLSNPFSPESLLQGKARCLSGGPADFSEDGTGWGNGNAGVTEELAHPPRLTHTQVKTFAPAPHLNSTL